ncbi:MAG: hypothetical protein IJY94_00455 [Clostridia bacterium]|nr:hypothetical protein [Clostridia bacterium]
MSKQDGAYTRTAAALERKQGFGKRFSELLGIVNETRDKVDSTESRLQSKIDNFVTSFTRNAQEIVIAAVADTYAKTEDLTELEERIKSELEVTAKGITMSFYEKTLQGVIENIEKHFEFTAEGLRIKSEAGSLELVLDNDVIKFTKDGQPLGWWDGDDFHTGNLYVKVNEAAKFGNHAFLPYEDDEGDGIDFARVGG